MTGEENKALVRRYIAELNQGHLDIVDELIAPDVRFNDDAIGRDGLKQYAAALRSAFPGMQIDIEDLIAEDDGVAFRYTWRGTNTGALVSRPDLPPTGRFVSARGFTLCQVQHGRITAAWDLDDRLSAVQQLGLLPATREAAPSPAGAARGGS